MDILALNKWIPNLTKPLVIAGPCSAETKEQVLATAHLLKDIESVRIFRAGIWKPRTRPNAFEGVGIKGLAWLQDVKEQTGLLTCTEVANAKHVEACLEFDVDILWIGARTAANPFSVQEIANALRGTNIPVMIKNPINADVALWQGAIERIYGAGIRKIAAIHRGFSSGDKSKYRNLPNWKIPFELQRLMPEIPMICDPSHITGKRSMIGEISQKAMDRDMDGLMIETHITPDEAWSDAAQQVTPSQLKIIMKDLMLRTEYTTDRHFEAELDSLRLKIDRIDREVIESLVTRMNVVKKIGLAKQKNAITPLQKHRMDELMRERVKLAESFGLTEKYITDLYQVIHSESVKMQESIICKTSDDELGDDLFTDAPGIN